ncbi:MAG: hypothetical protein AB1445_08565 [Bacillota bacterium]
MNYYSYDHPFDFTIGVKTLLRLDEFLLDCYPDQPEVLVYNRASEENLEEVIAHELVHLKLDALDQMLEDLLDAVYGPDPGVPGYRLPTTSS